MDSTHNLRFFFGSGERVYIFLIRLKKVVQGPSVTTDIYNYLILGIYIFRKGETCFVLDMK